jgi:hypothetical protein
MTLLIAIRISNTTADRAFLTDTIVLRHPSAYLAWIFLLTR